MRCRIFCSYWNSMHKKLFYSWAPGHWKWPWQGLTANGKRPVINRADFISFDATLADVDSLLKPLEISVLTVTSYPAELFKMDDNKANCLLLVADNSKKLKWVMAFCSMSEALAGDEFILAVLRGVIYVTRKLHGVMQKTSRLAFNCRRISFEDVRLSLGDQNFMKALGYTNWNRLDYYEDHAECPADYEGAATRSLKSMHQQVFHYSQKRPPISPCDLPV